MNKHSVKGEVKVLGIDLSKRSFQLHGVDKHGKVVLRKKLSRKRLLESMVNLAPCVVGIEACGGAHYWARKFRELGHEAHLMAPQFVKPYVKSNKHDVADAEAICEAVQCPAMRFVPIKQAEQQDLQSLHRARSLAVAQRTAQVNQIRGLLLEYGVEMVPGRHHVRRCLPAMMEDAENELSFEFRELLFTLYEQVVHWDEQVARFDSKLEQISQQNKLCVVLMTIPGIGPMVATALVAAVGDAREFTSGSEMAA